MSEYKVIYRSEQPEIGWQVGCPILFEAIQVARNTESARCYLQIKVRNISDRVVGRLALTGEVFDENGSSHAVVVDALDADIPAGKIYVLPAQRLEVSTVSKVSVQVVGADDAKDFERPSSLPEFERLSFVGAVKNERARNLFSLMRTSTTEEAVVRGVVLKNGWWRCPCGMMNIGRTECCGCGANRDTLIELENQDVLEGKLRDELAKAKELERRATTHTLARALTIYEKIGSFEDADIRLEACRNAYSEARKAASRKIKIACAAILIAAAIVVVSALVVTRVVIPAKERQDAYDNAVALMEKGNYATAAEAFKGLGDYKDAKSQAEAALRKIPEQLGSLEIGDVFEFGSHGDAIEWRVLAKEDDRILVVSSDVVDCRIYHSMDNVYENDYLDVTWESSDLRAWLNGDFYNSAFSSFEKKLICESEIPNPDNPEYGTYGGEPTKDKVFLLSMEEVEEYFTAGGDSIAKASSKAEDNGVWQDEDGGTEWWLRTPGCEGWQVTVASDGSVYDIGRSFDIDYVGVRPAMWVKTSLGKEKNDSAESGEPSKKDVDNPEESASPSSDVAADSVAQAEGESGQLLDQIAKLQEGDEFTLGSYGKAVKWRILAKEHGGILAITTKAIDCRPYNDEFAECTWETCNLRNWLNGEFYDTAFDADEKEVIRESELSNPENSEYGIDGGAETVDRVFLLSIDEAQTYLRSDNDRVCGGTSLVENGEYWNKGDNVCWWLRSPGNFNAAASIVDTDGSIDTYGGFVQGHGPCVRPAIWIDL